MLTTLSGGCIFKEAVMHWSIEETLKGKEEGKKRRENVCLTKGCLHAQAL